MSKSRDQFLDAPGGSIVLAILAMVILHFVWLGQNHLVCKHALKLPKREYRADVLLASQKTLPVAVTILSFLPDELGDKGLMVIPPIVGHMSQLFIDAWIVSRWVAADEREEEEAKAKEAVASQA